MLTNSYGSSSSSSSQAERQQELLKLCSSADLRMGYDLESDKRVRLEVLRRATCPLYFDSGITYSLLSLYLRKKYMYYSEIKEYSELIKLCLFNRANLLEVKIAAALCLNQVSDEPLSIDFAIPKNEQADSDDAVYNYYKRFDTPKLLTLEQYNGFKEKFKAESNILYTDFLVCITPRIINSSPKEVKTQYAQDFADDLQFWMNLNEVGAPYKLEARLEFIAEKLPAVIEVVRNLGADCVEPLVDLLYSRYTGISKGDPINLGNLALCIYPYLNNAQRTKIDPFLGLPATQLAQARDLVKLQEIIVSNTLGDDNLAREMNHLITYMKRNLLEDKTDGFINLKLKKTHLKILSQFATQTPNQENLDILLQAFAKHPTHLTIELLINFSQFFDVETLAHVMTWSHDLTESQRLTPPEDLQFGFEILNECMILRGRALELEDEPERAPSPV